MIARTKLKGTQSFKALLGQRPAQRSRNFVLFKATTQTPARLGVIVAKRYARQSVERNRIKRVLRETFRLTPPSHGDYLVRLVTRMEVVSTTDQKRKVRAQAESLFKRTVSASSTQQAVTDESS